MNTFKTQTPNIKADFIFNLKDFKIVFIFMLSRYCKVWAG